jgi:hypothetical protein
MLRILIATVILNKKLKSPQQAANGSVAMLHKPLPHRSASISLSLPVSSQFEYRGHEGVDQLSEAEVPSLVQHLDCCQVREELTRTLEQSKLHFCVSNKVANDQENQHPPIEYKASSSA